MAIGLALATLVIAAWATLHIWGVFAVDLASTSPLLVLLAVAAQTWLYVGMFIVAHDAIHGSLAPGRPAINRLIGNGCSLLYAGFAFDRLSRGHFDHHRAPGTRSDPDFDADHPTRFGVWFAKFFMTYFSWREFATLTLWGALYCALGAGPFNIMLFWALPALLSALQLFLFGTWLPHRHGSTPFSDSHRCRSSGYGWLLSLLTCFHFGYHEEHHRYPSLPWWRLPGARA